MQQSCCHFKKAKHPLFVPRCTFMRIFYYNSDLTVFEWAVTLCCQTLTEKEWPQSVCVTDIKKKKKWTTDRPHSSFLPPREVAWELTTAFTLFSTLKLYTSTFKHPISPSDSKSMSSQGSVLLDKRQLSAFPRNSAGLFKWIRHWKLLTDHSLQKCKWICVIHLLCFLVF